MFVLVPSKTFVNFTQTHFIAGFNINYNYTREIPFSVIFLCVINEINY